MKFKVAILQSRSTPGRLLENTERVISYMKEAAKEHADILLLPECFLTGYVMPVTNEEALADENPYLEKICEAAREYCIGVVVTTFTKGVEKPQNSALIVDKTGNVILKYSKVHTCDFAEEACLESGDDFYVCDFRYIIPDEHRSSMVKDSKMNARDVKLGVMICYDREYPESARVLMMKGAEIILVPNDCGSMRPRLTALSTRAYENMVGVVMANPVGENAGCSCAYSPICWDEDGKCVDNTLFLAGEEEEGLFYAGFDMDEIRAYREDEMMGNTFRKVKAYGELLNSAVEYPFIR